MDLLVGVLLVSLSAGIRAYRSEEVLNERDARSLYRHFDDEFEPFAFAAVPVHQPMQMLRVISPSPKYKFEVPYDDVESTYNYYPQQPIYSASMIDPRVTEPSDASSDPQFDVIYARPSKRGYTYRKQAGSRPTGLRPLRTYPAPEPVILRVHKYKYVRDR